MTTAFESTHEFLIRQDVLEWLGDAQIAVPKNCPGILGIDPGKNTGLAVWLPTGPRTAEIWAGKAQWPKDRRFFVKLIEVFGPDVVVEEFALLSKKAPKLGGAKFEVVEVIGWLRGHAEDEGFQLTMQNASIKLMMTREEMARILQNTKLVPRNPHARDALAHILYYIALLGGGCNE